MKNPTVSVIIPCYNYEQYVSRSIKSAAEQSYKDIEIIVINDGSTDDSDAKIKDLKKKYNFQYYSRENRGIIATRNEGIQKAKGDYLIQLDADDFLDSEFVKKTVEAAQKHKADIAYTQVKVFGRTDYISEHPDFNIEFLKHDNFIHASSLVRKSVFEKRKYDEYLGDKGNEDWDLFLDACMDGAGAVLVDEPLLNYQKHQGMNSRSDLFSNTSKEVLVRHHILSKQNAKHPKEMWYFSSYIKILENIIHEDTEKRELREKIDQLEIRINKITQTKIYRIYSRIAKILR